MWRTWTRLSFGLTRPAAVSRTKGVLERLGGVVLVPEDFRAEPVDAVAVTAHELVEAAVVPRGRDRHQLGVRAFGVVDAHPSLPCPPGRASRSTRPAIRS